uniref:Uncharacterized protein n=1 Tax=Trichogramma kaykai TaxID=54128 RepID=A0ABD2WU71_9HYME
MEKRSRSLLRHKGEGAKCRPTTDPVHPHVCAQGPWYKALARQREGPRVARRASLVYVYVQSISAFRCEKCIEAIPIAELVRALLCYCCAAATFARKRAKQSRHCAPLPPRASLYRTRLFHPNDLPTFFIFLFSLE